MSHSTSDILPTKTITFKTVDELEIQLDVYVPNQADKVPVLLWYHGGGLLQGRRDQLAEFMRQGINRYSFACVSADYRLAPQVGVQAILEDVKDCIEFIRTKLSSEVGEGALNVSRLAVSGSSAGGYLALLAGLYVDPKPQVILPIYPITDPLGTFFTNPQAPPLGRDPVEKAGVEAFLDMKSSAVAGCGPVSEDARMKMYTYMLTSATLPDLLHIRDPSTAEPFRISRNIYEHIMPSAYFLMGDADTAVGVEQADEVVGAMVGLGIEVKYERLHGKDHFLDTGMDYDNEPMFSFMLKHLNKTDVKNDGQTSDQQNED